MDTKPYCRKCLLSEMAPDGYFQSLRLYIEQLEPETKVAETVYAERLSRCKSCEQLLDGMCRLCGCYVELRAVMKQNACPAVHPLWTVQEDRNE